MLTNINAALFSQTVEKEITLPEICNGEETNELSKLIEKRKKSVPIVQGLVDDLIELGVVSQYHEKDEKTAVSKALRPTVLDKKPWFELRHIRDFLRFRSSLRSCEDLKVVFDQVVSWIEDGKVDLVKYENMKLSEPSVFGWRVVVFDFRIVETGLLIEYYVTFDTLMHASEDWLHAVFEKWRAVDMDTLTGKQRRQLALDTQFSYLSYEALFVKSATSDGSFVEMKTIIDKGKTAISNSVAQLCPSA